VGTGFTYSGSAFPAGGILTGFDQYNGITLRYTVTGLDLKISSLLKADATEGLAYLVFSGDDTVTGAGSDDHISTFAGNDSVTAGAGEDEIDLGWGNDTVDAGANDDGDAAIPLRSPPAWHLLARPRQRRDC
jgi:Ca2+-binding RTX toxin-like protein